MCPKCSLVHVKNLLGFQVICPCDCHNSLTFWGESS